MEEKRLYIMYHTYAIFYTLFEDVEKYSVFEYGFVLFYYVENKISKNLWLKVPLP